MSATDFRDMISNCIERPEGSGVLSTGQQIIAAFALCDPTLLPPDYTGGVSDILHAWARLSADEVLQMHQAMLMLHAKRR